MTAVVVIAVIMCQKEIKEPNLIEDRFVSLFPQLYQLYILKTW